MYVEIIIMGFFIQKYCFVCWHFEQDLRFRLMHFCQIGIRKLIC